jgi:hypothetical protein
MCPSLRHFELHLLETLQGDPVLHAEDFDPDDLIALVEIEDNARMHFFGFNDLGFVKSEIDCVGLFVEMNPTDPGVRDATLGNCLPRVGCKTVLDTASVGAFHTNNVSPLEPLFQKLFGTRKNADLRRHRQSVFIRHSSFYIRHLLTLVTSSLRAFELNSKTRN